MQSQQSVPDKASRKWDDVLRAIANQGDKEAFVDLFRHFAPRVKAYLMKLGCDAAQAEDLMQEAMAQVWRKAALFDNSKAGASTWIYTISRNLRIDHFRKTNRPEFDPEDPAFVGDPEEPADQQMHSQEVSERLRGILKELPEEQRTVVHLSFFEDKAHGEIANQLSLPLGTVKSRLRLAFTKIRSAWGENLEMTI